MIDKDFLYDFFRIRKNEPDGKYSAIICGMCGIKFMVPAVYIRNRQAMKQTVHCPSGHEINV